jgi:serine/threonine protein kinase
VKQILGGKNDGAELEKELHILTEVNHPCCVRFFGVTELPEGAAGLVMEYFALGSLASYLAKNGPEVQQHEQVTMCFDIAKGLEYLAGHGIIHRGSC